MSIEQLNEFHLVRRILRAVAPDFRLVASNFLSEGEVVLDVSQKTIEVGESTPIIEAVGAMLFQIGHLLLRKDPAFALLFGDGISKWDRTEFELIDTLSDLGQRADINAMRWAQEVFTEYWSVTPNRAREILSRQCWDRESWAEYFAA